MKEGKKMGAPTNEAPHNIKSYHNDKGIDNFKESNFVRCPHDNEHPYSITSNALIRDVSLSPNCRWLIIYLLSNKDGWRISVSQILNHLSPHMGRDKVYSIIKEAIDAGYIYRETLKEKGRFKRVIYYVSEFPKFRKNPSLPENPEEGNLHKIRDELKESLPHLDFTQAIDTDYNKDHKNNKYQKKEITSEAALRLASFFFDQLKSIKSDFKKPNLSKWAKELDRLLKERESEERIKNLIVWSLKNEFWKGNILSPSSLIKHFDKLEIQMNSPVSKTKEQQKEEKIQQVYDENETIISNKNLFDKFNSKYFIDMKNKKIRLIDNFHYAQFIKNEEPFTKIYFKDRDFLKKLKLEAKRILN